MNYNNTLYYGVSKTQIGTYSQIQSVSSIANNALNIANNANANTNTKAFIKFGNYIGTGTYGENNPMSLSLDFPIGFVWIFAYYSTRNNTYFLSYNDFMPLISYEILTTSYTKGLGLAETGTGDNYGKISPDGKTIYWYNSDNSSAQFNDNSYKYFYMLISR